VVSVTGAAGEKMKSFLNGDQNSYIRLSVKNDGPTGFMYDLKIDDVKPTDSDIVDDSNGFLLITDTKSSLYLDGATIDWETRPDGSAGFKFDNPNAIEK
jgi:iron-sulfur cluster assembly accessory protein